jgi:hypothetical protein
VSMADIVPLSVHQCQPLSVWDSAYRIRMTENTQPNVLWANICALLRMVDPSIDKVRAKLKVGRGTVQRIRDGDTGIRVGTLEVIAKACGVEAWQLLIPGIGPGNVPRIATQQDERAPKVPLSDEVVKALRESENPTKAENVLRVHLDLEPLPVKGGEVRRRQEPPRQSMS